MLKHKIISELTNIVGRDALLTDKEDLTVYSYDATTNWTHMPDAVIIPANSEQISLILKMANKNRIPVTARGGGTGLAGCSIPIKGGIVLCTTRMNKILEINKANLHAIVEPGVVLQDFNIALAKEGLFFPPDPQSFNGCTIGGNVATNAGGPACVKYGVVKQYVLGLEVVFASGDIVKLGGITAKNRQGYELAALLTGSEGTLGVITKIITRLLPAPPAQKSLLAVFAEIEIAGKAVSDILLSGVIPSKIEFMCNWFLRRVEELTPMGLPVEGEAMLLIQIDGTPESIESDAAGILSIIKDCEPLEARMAKDDAEAAMLWKARSNGVAAVKSAAHTILHDDVTVPRDKITHFIKSIREIASKGDLIIVLAGHAGDGNFHPVILTDNRVSQHYERATKALDEIVETALELGGVLSGKHGIGLSKQHFLNKAMDAKAINLMKKIKGVLDPNNILNPDKIWEN